MTDLMGSTGNSVRKANGMGNAMQLPWGGFLAHLDAVEFIDGQAAGDGEILDSVVEFLLDHFHQICAGGDGGSRRFNRVDHGGSPDLASFGLPKCTGSYLVPSRRSRLQYQDGLDIVHMHSYICLHE